MIHPLEDRVAVRRVEWSKERPSGLLLANNERVIEKGEVVAVGLGLIQRGQRIPLDVKVGDAVIFDRYAGTEAKDTETGDELVVMQQGEILSVLTSLDVEVMADSRK